VNQEFVLESFDLGEISVGEQKKIQIYFRNRTKGALLLKPISSSSELNTSAESISIEAGNGRLVNITLSVPKNSRDLTTSYRWEAMLSDGCRFLGEFKAKLLGVVSFEKSELKFEYNEAHTDRLVIPIPIVLSDVRDIGKLSLSVSDTLSFLSVSSSVIDGKPFLLASFFPNALDKQRYRGQVFLENKESTTRCEMNLTLTRKTSFSIFPARIVFIRKTGSTELIGEAVLRCEDSSLKVESISLDCEPSARS
jgi:hypothetical protein